MLGAEDIAKRLAAKAGSRAEAPPPARTVTGKRGQAESAQPAASDGRVLFGPAAAAASAAASAQPARDDGADVATPEADGESGELMGQEPIEIAARPKRQVSRMEETLEGKKARTIG
eukprot:5340568-Pyramimonas_sp.AAC.1